MEQDRQRLLERVAEHEATLRRTPVTRMLRALGRTRGFSAVYSRVGPVVDVWFADRTHGWIATRVYGFPALVLHTVGAKSGLPRASPLLYVRDGDRFVVVGTNFGQLTHPGWTANLRKQPEAVAEVGPVRVPVTAEELDDAGWRRLWPEFVAMYPGYANYLDRCGGRVPRMFALNP